ncbi:SET domain-containing protein [Desulfogranum japonicum]|uniref:SET domain-containing protein n=1 Tax=Desulfogranum japonicum TaxID=231447 RepID=UPI00048FFB76|nr:SET domain-containing protein [Desulfogranum japonicum]
MIHPSTEVRYINENIGYGLFATAYIPTGTITWVKDQLDREITPAQLRQYSTELQETILHYSYRNNRGNFIFCWDNTRYMNHNNNPNTCITAYQVEIAVRDIHTDEELTNHYGTLNILEPFELPGPDKHIVRPDDLLRYSHTWDMRLQKAFQFLSSVHQPLRGYLQNGNWDELCKVSKGECPMQSISTCYATPIEEGSMFL